MAQSLIAFTARRRRNLLALLLLAGGLLAWYSGYRLTLHRPVFLSGWLLLGTVLLLSLYNVRKRLSMLPVGDASTWLQTHLYLGLLAVLLFAVHVGPRVPDGVLESMLALSFVVVAGSGLLGLHWSRRLPRLVTRRGEEVIFERIPGFIAALRARAEAVVARAARETGSSTLADHYQSDLAAFFAGPRHLFGHLTGFTRPTYMQLQRLDALRRYLNEAECSCCAELRELVEKKDDLDFDYALQGALKAWLFLHVPLTGALLLLAIAHAVIVYAFTAGSG